MIKPRTTHFVLVSLSSTVPTSCQHEAMDEDVGGAVKLSLSNGGWRGGRGQAAKSERSKPVVEPEVHTVLAAAL